MIKIIAELEQALAQRAQNGGPGSTTLRRLAQGDGWTVSDAVCTLGPQDRLFEERHSVFSIAMVTAGTFHYHSAEGRALMTPGSLLLVNANQSFECGHEHGAGDRCISFGFEPGFFDRLAADAGIRGAARRFHVPRVPPLREVSSLISRASAALADSVHVSWEELAVQLAARTVQLTAGISSTPSDLTPASVARVTRAVRMIERDPAGDLTLGNLAKALGLSPYHFLRTFERLTGLTPHQYILRARLREAATRLALEPSKVIEIALDSGFGDVSNFNHAFRAEFGVSPRAFRRQTNGGK